MQPSFHHRLQARAQRQRGLPGAGPPTERDDPNVGIEQQVQRDTLFRGTSVQAEGLPVTPDEAHLLVRCHTSERRGAAAGGGEHQTGVAGQPGRLGYLDSLTGVEPIQVILGDGELGHAAPARVHRALRPVLLGREPHRGRLYPQRQIFCDKNYLVALPSKIERYRKNARVIVIHPKPWREHSRVTVV